MFSFSLVRILCVWAFCVEGCVDREEWFGIRDERARSGEKREKREF